VPSKLILAEQIDSPDPKSCWLFPVLRSTTKGVPSLGTTSNTPAGLKTSFKAEN